ncbi:lamina-associated polypeptide 2, isoforms alpha/zeta-like [Xenopus tropicalis]|uniref:Lamina-associated polypeptide 2, isoforms alpha/zeta-like n=1 Tax=Xenopus tropicalis TaxID=8364 RepID=A0A8J1JKT5_XENTR|nr:lamina-associated polypeptide 2, isoforms alpha/zeta-like [Xenopus tropicalis]
MEPAASKRAASRTSGDSVPVEEPVSKRDKHHGKEDKELRMCKACDNSAIKGRRLCQICLEEYATRDLSKNLSATPALSHASYPERPSTSAVAPVDQSIIRDWVREAVSESLKNLPGSKEPSAQSKIVLSSGDEGECSFSDEEDDDEDESQCFETKLVPSLIKAVRRTLSLEVPQPESSISSLFSKKKKPFFPVHPEIKDIMNQEWAKGPKKTPVEAKIAQLYPFSLEDLELWENLPTVDAPVARLSKKTALPIDDISALKHPMDRRMETELKKLFITAGAACKPSVSIVSVSKAISIWADNIEQAVLEDSPREKIAQALLDLKKAAEFCLEAAIDLSRLSARNLMYSVAARRALWLRSWYADTASKNTLCKLPYEGKRLFGKSLDDIIAKSSGGKSTFLPQTKRFFDPKKQNDRYSSKRREDSRYYRPGREFKAPWRSGQSSFFRGNKSKGPRSPKNQPKAQ